MKTAQTILSKLGQGRAGGVGGSQLIHFGGTVAANILIFGLNILTAVFAARLLGPTGRGELAAIQNWAFFAVILGNLGIAVAASYYAGKKPTDAGRLFSTGLLFLLVIAVPLVAVMYFVLPTLLAAQDKEVVEAARIFLLFIPIQFVTLVPYHIFHGLNRLSFWNALRILMPFLWLLVFLIGFIRGGIDAIIASRGYLISASIYCASWLLAMVVLIRARYHPDMSKLPALVGYGLPTMLASVPRQLNLRVDQLMMAAFLPAQTLGLYVVAVAWGGLMAPLMTSISQVLFPRMARTTSRQEQHSLLQRSLSFSVLVGVILTGLILILTPSVIPLVFGIEFAAAVPVAFVLVVAGLVASLNNLMGEAFRGMGMPKRPMIAELVGLVCTAVLLLLLLPRFQLMGAAVASVVSYMITFGILLTFVHRETNLSIREALIPSKKDFEVVWDLIAKVVQRG